ncbi:MAG: hypothetical protein K0S56_3116, partial [Microvirga sp.]|nr:hypothetical protein [Microvirga sp.]
MDELTLLAILLVLTIPVCAVTALFLALGARRSAAALRLRLEAVESELQRSRGAIEPPIAGESLPAAATAPPAVESLQPEQPRTTPTVPPISAAPRKDSGLEDRLGSRWAVWVGGIALALGGIFLVRYSIEQNLLAPGVRVMIGLLFAAGLIGVGEWLRRRERDISLPGFPSANVPSVLTAAGTCTAFASIYAAYALYGLISPAATFVLLGAVAVLTMAAAILHGPALAALGLIGAMGSPLLVSSQEPQPWALVIYLPFVVLAAYGVARFRRWRWLALAAAGGALLWSPLIALADERTVLPLMVHLALQTAFAALFLVADPYRSTADDEARIDWPASLVLLLFSLASVLTASAVEAGSARPFFAGIVALVLLATGFRFAAAAPATAIAALTVVGTLLVWPIGRDVAGDPENIFYMSGDIFAVRPDALAAYLIFACVLVPLVSAASLLRLTLAGQLRLPIAAWYAGA